MIAYVYYRLPAKALPTVITRWPHFLEQRGLEPSALWPLLGSRGRVSEILSRKRAISKDQAKKLATFFHVGAGLFI